MKEIIRPYFFSCLLVLLTACSSGHENKHTEEKTGRAENSNNTADKKNIDSVARVALKFCKKKKFNTKFCFLVDMSVHSGRDRFFVYDLQKNTILSEALVAHGSCNCSFLAEASFSNTSGSGCTSPGKYKIGNAYNGRFGKAYKLYGLDSTNSRAFERNIVLHSYYLVPDTETYPTPICNSLGCPMVSSHFFEKISPMIDASSSPVLLWIF